MQKADKLEKAIAIYFTLILMTSIITGLSVFILHFGQIKSSSFFGLSGILTTLSIFASLIVLLISLINEIKQNTLVIFAAFLFLAAQFYTSLGPFIANDNITLKGIALMATDFNSFLLDSRKLSLIFIFDSLIHVFLCLLYFYRREVIIWKNIFDTKGIHQKIESSPRVVGLRLVTVSIAAMIFAASYSYSFVYLLMAKTGYSFTYIDEGKFYSVEKTFAKGEKEVVLIPMSHIGRKKFYESIFDKYNGKDISTAYLIEGVKDDKNLLKKGGIFYNKVSSVINVSNQKDVKPDEDEFKAITIWGDVDVSSFDPVTIKFLNRLSLSKKDESLSDVFLRLLLSNPEPKDLVTIFSDIDEKRNQNLFNVFSKVKDKYPLIVVPWGALHMPPFEKLLKENGYQLVSEQSRVIFSINDVMGENEDERAPASKK